MTTDYRLLVFDWDGTLADSLGYITTALAAAIDETGLEPRREPDLLGIIGLGLEQAFASLYPALGPPERERLAAAYRQHFLRLSAEPIPLYPGARESLALLRERGYLLAVATGKSRRGLDRALQESGLENWFDASRCADETFSKPHPQMLLDLMEQLAVQPGETVMIGDSQHDLQMAGNAGVASIAVTHGAQSARRLLEFNPVASIHHLGELAPWLARRGPEQAQA